MEFALECAIIFKATCWVTCYHICLLGLCLCSWIYLGYYRLYKWLSFKVFACCQFHNKQWVLIKSQSIEWKAGHGPLTQTMLLISSCVEFYQMYWLRTTGGIAVCFLGELRISHINHISSTLDHTPAIGCWVVSRNFFFAITGISTDLVRCDYVLQPSGCMLQMAGFQISDFSWKEAFSGWQK